MNDELAVIPPGQDLLLPDITDTEILDLMSGWPSFAIVREEGGIKLMVRGMILATGYDIREVITRLVKQGSCDLVSQLTKTRFVGLPMTSGLRQTIIRKPHAHIHHPYQSGLPATRSEVQSESQEGEEVLQRCEEDSVHQEPPPRDCSPLPRDSNAGSD